MVTPVVLKIYFGDNIYNKSWKQEIGEWIPEIPTVQLQMNEYKGYVGIITSGWFLIAQQNFLTLLQLIPHRRRVWWKAAITCEKIHQAISLKARLKEHRMAISKGKMDKIWFGQREGVHYHEWRSK